MKARCPKCGETFNLGARVFGKLGGLFFGGLLGGGVTAHPVGVALGALAGTLVGHAIDEEVLPDCPSCRVALEAIDVIV